MSSHYAYLCPICEREMVKVGFCHLECPAGHYQEVCSDLFQADRIELSVTDAQQSAQTEKRIEAELDTLKPNTDLIPSG